MPTEQIPITFEFRGKQYSGHFNKILGAGSSSMFFLSIDNYHYGQLWYTDRWRFSSNGAPEMEELSDFFGDYVTAWYG